MYFGASNIGEHSKFLRRGLAVSLGDMHFKPDLGGRVVINYMKHKGRRYSIFIDLFNVEKKSRIKI